MREHNLVQLYLTNQCNSHCKTCSIWKNKEEEQLSLVAIENVVKAAASADSKTDFVLGGGEPILYRSIGSVIRIMNNYNVNYTFLTNCVAVLRVRKFIMIYDVKNVTVSFDGVNHDYIRETKSNAKNILDFVEWCRGNDVNVKLSYTYSALNENTFEKDMDYIKDVLGFDKVYFCIARNTDIFETNGNIVAKDFTRILDRADMLYDKDVKFIKRMISEKKKKCDSQTSVFTIYSNGDLVRCQSYLSNDIICNVYDKSSEDLETIFRDIKGVKCPYDKECNALCQRRYD